MKSIAAARPPCKAKPPPRPQPRLAKPGEPQRCDSCGGRLYSLSDEPPFCPECDRWETADMDPAD